MIPTIQVWGKTYMANDDSNIYKTETINLIQKFDPNQPRDEDGKWTDTGASLRGFENRIKGQKHETAGIFDKDGNFIFEKDGNENSVSFTDNEQEQMAKTTFTHNHPQNKGFSKADIQFMIKNKINEMRAVTEYGVFKMSKKHSKGLLLSEFNIAYIISYEKAKVITNDWWNKNDNTKDWVVKKANEMIVSETWEAFMETNFYKNNLDYQFIPNKYL